MRDFVIVIGSRINVLRAAVDLGLTPVLVREPGDPDPETAGLCAEVTSMDLLDEEGVVECVERLHRRYDARRVISLSEDGLIPAARVNERHGLGGNSLRSVRLLKDKAAMRRRLAEVDLGPVSAQVVASADELASFARTVGGRLVVKPLDAGGSNGVHLLPSPDDADAVWRAVAAAGRRSVLAEEYLEGPEISIEAFSHAGRHTVVAITQKILGVGFIEVGHAVPAEMDGALECDAVDMTVGLLDAVGLVEGPSHTELKLTDAGPRVVESHNRIGGDNIADLVREVHGVDLERLAVGVPLGLLEWTGAPPPSRGGAAIRFLTPPPGVVRSIERPAGVEPGISLEVTIDIGDVVPPLTWSKDRVAGHVMATGTSRSDALRRCERALAGVQITTEAA